MAERLKVELNLTDEQVATLVEALNQSMARARAEQPQSAAFGRPQRSGGDQSGAGRFMKRIEQIIEPMLTEDQRPLFEAWKQQRNNSRSATVWVLGPNGQLEQRFVRLGLGDDQFTEIIGGNVRAGDQVVIRAREVRS
jgi:HlyD family secretion protein